jgi:hypothetical protein
MGDSSARIFSLVEANEVVPRVVECTAEVVHQLDEIRQRYKTPSEEPGRSVPEWVLKEVEEALVDWSKRVSELGAVPKGYFTVDFQSVDPELLYCWTYGEEKIAFTHRVWENFSHRRPIESSAEHPTDHLKWVN